jgi:UTP-glucose-1-phosphate uridylyltransferase
VNALNNMVETVLLNGKRYDCGIMKGYVGAIKDVVSNYKFD